LAFFLAILVRTKKIKLIKENNQIYWIHKGPTKTQKY